MSDRVNLARFFSTSSTTFVVRAVAAGIAFLMNVVVTRTLGAHEAGLFFLGQAILVILAMLSRFGLDHLIVRLVSIATDQSKPAVANAVLVKAAIITIPLSLIASLISFAYAEFIATKVLSQPEFTPTLRTVSCCILPFALFQVISFGLQGRSQVATSVAINTAFFPGMLLVSALVASTLRIESSSDLSFVAVAIAIANAGISLIIWAWRSPLVIDFSDDAERKLTTAAFPLFWISVILLANAWLPQLVLAGYGSPEEIAMLSNAQKTASLVGFLLLAINSAASPTFAAMYDRNQHDALREFAARVNGIVLLTTIPLLLIVFLFASPILSIFGAQFSQAAWLLRVLIVGQFINAATGSVGYLLVMSGHERSFRNATALSAIVGVGLCFLLIPTFGTLGAAVVTAVVVALSNIFAAIQVYYRLGINVLKPDVGYLVRGLGRRCFS